MGATDFAETGSGIRKRKSVSTDLQTAAVDTVNAKRRKLGSSDGQTDL